VAVASTFAQHWADTGVYRSQYRLEMCGQTNTGGAVIPAVLKMILLTLFFLETVNKPNQDFCFSIGLHTILGTSVTVHCVGVPVFGTDAQGQEGVGKHRDGLRHHFLE